MLLNYSTLWTFQSAKLTKPRAAKLAVHDSITPTFLTVKSVKVTQDATLAMMIVFPFLQTLPLSK